MACVYGHLVIYYSKNRTENFVFAIQFRFIFCENDKWYHLAKLIALPAALASPSHCTFMFDSVYSSVGAVFFRAFSCNYSLILFLLCCSVLLLLLFNMMLCSLCREIFISPNVSFNVWHRFLFVSYFPFRVFVVALIKQSTALLNSSLNKQFFGRCGGDDVRDGGDGQLIASAESRLSNDTLYRSFLFPSLFLFLPEFCLTSFANSLPIFFSRTPYNWLNTVHQHQFKAHLRLGKRERARSVQKKIEINLAWIIN